MRVALDMPQLRVCALCARHWFSAAHCSLEVPAHCGDCGSPLLETFSTTTGAIRAKAARPKLFASERNR